MPLKFNYKIGTNEIKFVDFWQCLIGEFIGNFILNFFAVGACTQASENGVFKALAFGFAIFMAITIVGHISGGHVNPAVSIAMFAVGKISLIKTICYIIFQCLGSIAGTAVIKALLSEGDYNGLGHTALKDSITPAQGFGFEFFNGFVLLATVFGACDANKPTSAHTAPFAIGMAVALGHLGTITYTGSSMNPARTLGTAVMTGNFSNHWVYWIGPILGGIVAALLYSTAFEAKPSYDVSNTSDRYKTQANDTEVNAKV